jgi:hypothetical protein
VKRMSLNDRNAFKVSLTQNGINQPLEWSSRAA